MMLPTRCESIYIRHKVHKDNTQDIIYFYVVWEFFNIC